ncbi:hypothetical protein DM02DRAFT_619216 [Periconia macrospinosa]|uniref:Uncharacterized protein n=1 Tax=Periconia macrospinosa TaxID=97972 RepID=A0A2V1D623_9PLEO|nr:hypothetical protein DM02DRAFT_619216 [Periconia macrospinosa]
MGYMGSPYIFLRLTTKSRADVPTTNATSLHYLKSPNSTKLENFKDLYPILLNSNPTFRRTLA